MFLQSRRGIRFALALNNNQMHFGRVVNHRVDELTSGAMQLRAYRVPRVRAAMLGYAIDDALRYR
jgi:hypothetical protein